MKLIKENWKWVITLLVLILICQIPFVKEFLQDWFGNIDDCMEGVLGITYC